MWFMLILWKSFRGLWRLVVGLIIGVILYIYTFTTPSLEWIFNDVFAFSHSLIEWLSAQDWFGQYEKWNNLVKPGDRLPLILYVLVGRFIWLMLESVFITFPYWLMFGRNKEKKTAKIAEASVVPQKIAVLGSDASIAADKQGAPALGKADSLVKSALETAKIPAAKIAVTAAASAELASGKAAQVLAEAPAQVPEKVVEQVKGTGVNLERHIDDALQQVRALDDKKPAV